MEKKLTSTWIKKRGAEEKSLVHALRMIDPGLPSEEQEDASWNLVADWLESDASMEVGAFATFFPKWEYSMFGFPRLKKESLKLEPLSDEEWKMVDSLAKGNPSLDLLLFHSDFGPTDPPRHARDKEARKRCRVEAFDIHMGSCFVVDAPFHCMDHDAVGKDRDA